MRVAGRIENYGVEQEHLNQVFGARLRITGLRAGRGPGIEFLEYITPPGGRPLPIDSKANDLVFWTTTLREDHFDDFLSGSRLDGVRFVSKQPVLADSAGESPSRIVILRDPDGHALKVIEAVPNSLSAK
jgi:hypothetical protein